MARQLIIGYEESEQGADALMLGQLLGEVLAAELVVASVALLPLGRGSSEMGLAVTESAEQLQATLRGKITGRVDARVLAGNSAAAALNDLIEEEDPIAVVLGSGHHGPVGRILVGSVGEALLSGASCPIAVAPRGYAEQSEHRLRRIGVAFNGEEESQAGLAAAISLAERVHAALTVVGVVEPLSPGYGTLLPVIDATEFEESGREAMTRIVEEAAEGAPSGLGIETRVQTGAPAAQAIAEIAAELNLDLVILGSRAYGPIRRVLLGGVATQLMRSAPCPVLILPRGAGEDPLGYGGPSGQ